MGVDLPPVAAVQNVVALHNARSATEAQMLVYSKALEIASEGVTSLVESLPQPALATSGTLGRHVNVYA